MQALFENSLILIILGMLIGGLSVFIILNRKRIFSLNDSDIYSKEEQLNIFLTKMTDFMYIKDTESRFVAVNKKNSDVFHLKGPKEMIGKTDLDFYPKEFAEKYYSDEKQIFSTGKPLIGVIEKALDENGDIIYISTSKYPLFNKKNRIVGLVGIGRDITDIKQYDDKLLKSNYELKKVNDQLKNKQEYISEQAEQLRTQAEELEYANEQLTELIKTRDKFFSIIAHDLKNPVNLLKGFSELLIYRYKEIDDERRYRYIETLHRTIIHLTDLLEKLLQWARMQTGGMNFEPEVINISAFLEENLTPLNELSEQKNIRLTSDFKYDENLCVGDRNMLDFVFRNLVTNAVKYTKRGGEISVSFELKDDKAVFCISDNGVGIEENLCNELFKLTRNRTKEGTEGELGSGLGLFLCKDFIERNHGEIWCKSKINEGTNMFFSVPLVQNNDN